MARWKRPLLGSVVLGLNSNTSDYEEIQTYGGGIYAIVGTDGTNKLPLKVDTNGRLEILSAFDGSQYYPIKSDSNGRIEGHIATDGVVYRAIKVDANGRLEVLSGFDGSNYMPIKTNNVGEVYIADRKKTVVNLINTSVQESTEVLPSPILIEKDGMLRVYLSVQGATDTAKIIVRRTLGGATVDEYLNGRAPLLDNSAYIFDICVTEGEQINLVPYVDGSGTLTITFNRLIAFFIDELL